MEYSHENKTYKFEMNFMSAIYALFMLISGFFILINILRFIMIIVFIVCFYSFYRNKILKSYVQKVRVNNKSLEFIIEDVIYFFDVDQLLDVKIKQYTMDNNLYIKIKNKSKSSRKFVLNINKFENKENLLDELINYAYIVNPKRKILKINMS